MREVWLPVLAGWVEQTNKRFLCRRLVMCLACLVSILIGSIRHLHFHEGRGTKKHRVAIPHQIERAEAFNGVGLGLGWKLENLRRGLRVGLIAAQEAEDGRGRRGGGRLDQRRQFAKGLDIRVV